VTSIQQLEEVEGFPSPDLTHNDAVWPVTQRRPQQVTDGDRWRGRLPSSGLEPDQVAFADVDFCRVFNENNAFFVRNEVSQNIEQGGLARCPYQKLH
jgi:hypothetical protein